MDARRIIFLSLLFHFIHEQDSSRSYEYNDSSEDYHYNYSYEDAIANDYSYNISNFISKIHDELQIRKTLTPLTELKDYEKRCAEDPTTDPRCGCDPECARYGDCCPDSIYFKAEEQKLGASTASCHTDFDTHFYMMTRCPSAWENSQTRYLCENPDPTYPNPMLDTFVTSLRTNVTYRNSYCASCHNDLHQDIYHWPRGVFCEFNRHRVQKLDSLEYFQRMVYDETLSHWYFDLSGLTIERRCVPCTISFFEDGENCITATNCPSPSPVYFPNDTKVFCRIISHFSYRMLKEQRLRRCKFSISKCASDWNDTTEREKCEAYMSQVYACPNTYRNYHCALCNYVVHVPSRCILGKEQLYWNHAFSELLHWRYGVTCEEGEVFDTLSRQCIKVLSHQRGTRMEAGSCTNMSFPKEEYILSDENNTVFVPNLKATYYQHEFFIHDELLILCLPENLARQFAPELRYITMVGIALSITCIVLHLLVLCLVPKLINLPAMNLASLCVSLLLLYSSFIVNGTVYPGTASCVIVAVVMHYSMLASLFWMFIISFDIFRMTRRTQAKLVALKGRQIRRFTLYSATGWLTPAIIAGSAVLLDHVIPTSSFAPGYKAQRCWFSRANALLLFCLTPVIFVMSLNVVFFIWTSYLIRRMRHSTKKAAEHRNFSLHLRLFVITGLTWITGITAAAVDVKVLWHFFVVFNTLQGVFIFLTFTCSTKVLKELKNLFRNTISFETKVVSTESEKIKTDET